MPSLGCKDCSKQGVVGATEMQQPALQSHDAESPQLSPIFTDIMAFIIVLSTARLGMQCQWSPDKYPGMAEKYFVADLIFLSLFIGEILIKLIVLRCKFFGSLWNILDVVITLLGVLDMVVKVLPGSRVSLSLHKLHVLRFLRVIRLVRVLKGIDELVVVVEGIINAMTSVAWVCLLLLIIVYMFGVFITMELAHDKNILAEFGDIDYFGDLQHSMLTLLDIALLVEWPEIVRPIMRYKPMLLPVFLVFVVITSFGIMNILVGVVVTSTVAARREIGSDHARQTLAQTSVLWVDAVHKQGLGQKEVQSREGTAQYDELLQRREKGILSVLQAVMDNGSIEFPQGFVPQDVVNLLDFDGSNDLSHDEFIAGLGRLLLGNEFQLTCLMLTMLCRMRKERSMLLHEVQRAIDRNRVSMEDRIQRIEEKLQLKSQVRNERASGSR